MLIRFFLLSLKVWQIMPKKKVESEEDLVYVSQRSSKRAAFGCTSSLLFEFCSRSYKSAHNLTHKRTEQTSLVFSAIKEAKLLVGFKFSSD